MKKYKEVVLDLTDCEHVGMIQPKIKEAFDFPSWYGENWDAFKDFLFYEYPVAKVTVIGAYTLPPIFDRDMQILRAILEKAKEEYREFDNDFSYEWK